MLVDGELTLKYKTYTIKSQDNSLEELKKGCVLNEEIDIYLVEKTKRWFFTSFGNKCKTVIGICSRSG